MAVRKRPARWGSLAAAHCRTFHGVLRLRAQGGASLGMTAYTELKTSSAFTLLETGPSAEFRFPAEALRVSLAL